MATDATTQPTTIPLIEPADIISPGLSLSVVLVPARVVVLLGAAVGVAIRSVDLQLICIMGAQALKVSIVVV